MIFDLPFSKKFRLNNTELGLIRLALNEVIGKYDKENSDWWDHQWKALRQKFYIEELYMNDLERNLIRSNWGGDRIYTIDRFI